MNAKVLCQLLGINCLGREYFYDEGHGSLGCYVRIIYLWPDIEFSPFVATAEYLQPSHFELMDEFECERDFVAIADFASLRPAHYSTEHELWCITGPGIGAKEVPEKRISVRSVTSC